MRWRFSAAAQPAAVAVLRFHRLERNRRSLHSPARTVAGTQDTARRDPAEDKAHLVPEQRSNLGTAADPGRKGTEGVVAQRPSERDNRLHW